MKILFLLLSLMIFIDVNAQQNTFNVDSIKSTEIIKRARIWLAENISDSNEAIELFDENTIIVNSSFSPEVKNSFGVKNNSGMITFSLKIEAKDNKYRTTFSNFYHKSLNKKDIPDGGSLEDEKPDGGMFSMQNKMWKQYQAKSQEFVIDIEKSLHDAILINKNEDW